MAKIYLGVTGRILSGKSSAAKFFVEHFNAEHLRFSKVIDEILNVLDLPITRIHEQDMGVLLKDLYGEEILTKALMHRAELSNRNVIVFEGIRKKEEIDELRKLENFKFIYIKADQQMRYQRMLQRSEKLSDQTQTFEEFKASESHEADRYLSDLENYADYVIENNGSREEFEAQLTRILTQSL